MTGGAPKMLFVGNATEDSILFVRELPANDIVAMADNRLHCLGGRGVVPALVAAALGMDAHLCTVIGADRRAAFTSFLETYHVGHDLVKWDEQNDGITQYVAFVDPGVGATYAAARLGL